MNSLSLAQAQMLVQSKEAQLKIEIIESLMIARNNLFTIGGDYSAVNAILSPMAGNSETANEQTLGKLAIKAGTMTLEEYGQRFTIGDHNEQGELETFQAFHASLAAL